MTFPPLAVLIPVHNNQRGLEASVASLGDQGEPFDLIIVDDGSFPVVVAPPTPPGSRTILLRLDRNRGIVEALNLGLNFVLENHYEYVARLDAGDIAHPHRLHLQASEMRARPELVLLGSYATIVTSSGRRESTMVVPTGTERIRRAIHYRACFIHPAVMFRTLVFKEVGYYRHRYRHAEDYDLFMRIARRFAVDNLPKALIDYQFDNDSISSRHWRRQTLSIMKTCLAHFRVERWESYYGILRRIPNLMLSRQGLAKLKKWFGLVRALD